MEIQGFWGRMIRANDKANKKCSPRTSEDCASSKRIHTEQDKQKINQENQNQSIEGVGKVHLIQWEKIARIIQKVQIVFKFTI